MPREQGDREGRELRSPWELRSRVHASILDSDCFSRNAIGSFLMAPILVPPLSVP